MIRAWNRGTARPLTDAITSGSGSGRGDGTGAAVGVTLIGGGGDAASGREVHAPDVAASRPRAAIQWRVIRDGVGYAKPSADPILHVLDPHRVGPRLEPAGARRRGRPPRRGLRS